MLARSKDELPMSQAKQTKMTVEEFFDWQQRQDRNYELVDGVPVVTVKAMTGASRRHDRVTVNALATLHGALKGKPCSATTDDQSVLTDRGTRRPDITVDCGKADDSAMAVADPRVVIEVLSPSTTRYDRFQKLEEYKRHPAIRVILLVDSEAPQVTVWRRVVGVWTYAELPGLDAVIPLPEIDAELPLAELYADLTFETPPRP
jgi:Uma2 family endonuclease